MKGSVTRRGKRSWRLKYDIERGADGRRNVRYETIRGTRREAEAALVQRLAAVNAGVDVSPSDLTVQQWLMRWLAKQKLSARSVETYAAVVKRLVRQIGPIKIQKLRPVHVSELAMVKRDGSPLSAAAERQTRRVLKAALQAAVEIELIGRNVGLVGARVAAEDTEVDIPSPSEIAAVLDELRDNPIFPIVALALASGARRGEILGLRWTDINMDTGTVTIVRSLEKTVKYGLKFTKPKTKYGRRAITVPAETIDVLREHRRQQLELRMKIGAGRPGPDALVFCTPEGKPLRPDALSEMWKRAVKGRWTFHAIRHCHASALIAAGIDIVTISRRLGHSGPHITLSTYSHAFRDTPDTAAAEAISKVLGAKRVPSGGRGP